MNTILKLSALALMGLAFTACQTMPYQPYARDVKRKPRLNGIIAMKLENRPEDQEKAQQMMKSNCGDLPVKVIDEGEVAVGQEVKGSSDTSKTKGYAGTSVGSIFGVPVISGGSDGRDSTASTSVTTSIKEWQISYECDTVKTKR